MPIAGLSQQKRLPRLGKIHLGVKKTTPSGTEYPTATDYFVVPPEVTKYLGDKSTSLSILIPVEDDELWCPQYYKCYSRMRGLTCRGDGVKCNRMIDTATGAKATKDSKTVEWKVGLECKGRECPDYLAKECKETMNLQVVLPDAPGLGIWQIDTSSVNSIRNINSDAEMIRAVYKHISFIPLLLKLEPQEVIDPDGKKKTVRCLHLRTNGTMRELMLAAAKPITELLLPPTSAEDDEAPLDVPPECLLEGPGPFSFAPEPPVVKEAPPVAKVSEPPTAEQRAAADELIRQAAAASAVEKQQIKERAALTKHRTSIIDLSRKHYGQDAYIKVVQPYVKMMFHKELSELTIDELPYVDQWLAEQIKQQQVSAAGGTATTEADKNAGSTAEKSKPRGKSKKAEPKEKITTRVPEDLPKVLPQDQVRKVIAELKAKKWSEPDIKQILFAATGKKSLWLNDDVPAIRKAIQEKEATQTVADLGQTNAEVTKFLQQAAQD